jgi:hypothetical protein
MGIRFLYTSADDHAADLRTPVSGAAALLPPVATRHEAAEPVFNVMDNFGKKV